VTALGDRFAGTRLRRVSGQKAEPPTPARTLCPATERPAHLWWGAHCYLDKVLQGDYGFTCDDYHRLLARQGGRCALCRGRPRTWRLVPDHNHQTGAVDALLHFSCNRFKEALLAWLLRLLAYLADPPGRDLGLVVPAAKLAKLEAKDRAKRRRAQARRVGREQAKAGPPSDETFAGRVQAALKATSKEA